VTEPVRWGILSTAHINRLVIPPAHESPKVELIAVASRDQRRADGYAREWGIPRAYGSYQALLGDADVEVIYISLPNGQHVEWSTRALEAGKHVLCEKPLSRHTEDVERAFDLAEREGLLLSEAFMYRHHPQSHRLVELVESGAIGTLQTVRAAFSFTLPDLEDIRLNKELEGGALMDVGCYCVNGTRLLSGEPDRVYGEQLVGPTGVDVRFHGMLHFPSGVVGQFDCGLVLPMRDELEAIGDEGSLFLDDPWHAREPVIELRRQSETTERIEIEPANSYRLELDNVSDAVRGEAELLLGRADAVGQVRVIEALYRSANAGEAVTL
jgi:D-xylose 1-dehydrogenase (NADP+, D-xylono-1,5-lactone-forming)